MKKFILLFLFSLFIIGSCKSDEQDLEVTGPNFPVNLRIRNISDYDFKSVIMNPQACSVTENGSFNYGDILVDATSNYHHFSYSHDVPSIKLTIDDKDFFIKGFCDGEMFLSGGNLTVQIFTYETDGEVVSLGLNMVTD